MGIRARGTDPGAIKRESSTPDVATSSKMATHWQRQGVGRAKASAKGKAPSHVRLCAFCLGTDEMNRKTKKPEPLVCCSECGSCGTYLYAYHQDIHRVCIGTMQEKSWLLCVHTIGIAWSARHAKYVWIKAMMSRLCFVIVVIAVGICTAYDLR